MKTKNLILLILNFIFSISLYAEANVWVINKDHSDLLLSIPYMEVSNVSARLKSFSGKIYFDKDAPEKILKFNVQIKSASFDSNHNVRDGHVKGEDFLDTNTYPYIIFKSSQVIKEGNQYKVHGELTIKGQTHPHDLTFMISKSIKDSWGHLNRFVSFTTVVNRQDYGVNWTKGILGKGELLVGDKITLNANVQIQPLGDRTPMYKHMLPNTEYIKLSEKLHRGEITKDEFEKNVMNQATKFPGKGEEKATTTPKTRVIPMSKEAIPLEKAKTPSMPEERDQLWWFAFTLVTLIGLTTIALSFGLFYEANKEEAKQSKGGSRIFLTKVWASAAIVLIIFFNCLSYLASHGK